MNKKRFPRLAALAAALFEQPISKNYIGLSIILIVLGGFVVYTDNNFPDIAKHLVTMAIMVGIARLFNTEPMRWAWVGVVGIMSLLLALDVAILFT